MPILYVASALLAVLILSGLAPPAEAQRKKVLSIAAKEPDSLDPHSSTNNYPELLKIVN